MNQLLNLSVTTYVNSPITGDRLRPWLAAVILIASVIILVAMLVIRKPSDTDEDSSLEDSFQDEDE